MRRQAACCELERALRRAVEPLHVVDGDDHRAPRGEGAEDAEEPHGGRSRVRLPVLLGTEQRHVECAALRQGKLGSHLGVRRRDEIGERRVGERRFRLRGPGDENAKLALARHAAAPRARSSSCRFPPRRPRPVRRRPQRPGRGTARPHRSRRPARGSPVRLSSTVGVRSNRTWRVNRARRVVGSGRRAGGRVGDQIVGRDAELAAVERFLAALSDEPAALVVEGEAGIGKTTVWLEAIRLADARGLRVLRARPTESEARLSFATLADLVGDVFEELRDSLPPVQERALAAALLRGEPNEGADPRTIATGFVGMLAALAERGSVLVAVDDVQWLDPASEGALAFAARRLPPRLGLLLTRRTAGVEELPLGLGAGASGEPRRARRPGAALAGRAVPPRRRAARSVAAAPSARASVGRLGRQPVLRAGDRADARRGAGGHERRRAAAPAAQPRGSRGGPRAAAVGAHAASRARGRGALAAERRDLVEACAPESDARAALVEAEEAGVLLSERERVRFTHPLIASAVYGSASPERRRQLHERLAAVVSDTEQRARHLALSATEPDEEIAATLERAAQQAAARGAQRAAASSSRRRAGSRRPACARSSTGACSARRRRCSPRGTSPARRSSPSAPRASPVGRPARRGALPARRDPLGRRHVGGRDREPRAGAGGRARRPGAGRASTPEARLLHRGAPPGAWRSSVPTRPSRLSIPSRRRARSPRSAPTGSGPGSSGRSILAELLERWRELEARAGPDAPKSTIPLIHFHSVDEFEAARARHAVEDEWYRLRGQDDWRAERQAHRSSPSSGPATGTRPSGSSRRAA